MIVVGGVAKCIVKLEHMGSPSISGMDHSYYQHILEAIEANHLLRVALRRS